jgi:hypothetical protein
MPERITIDGLRIEDADFPESYAGPAIFSNVNPAYKDETYVQKFPYVTPRQVILKNVITTSGKPLRVSDNAVMFKDVEVKSTPDAGTP